MYSAPDDKKTNTMLDKLNVDDEVAAIVDDTVEDNFLNVALDALEGMSDDDDIPDINQKLADWLKSKYDARTVDGFQEGKQIKITRDQLRTIVEQVIGYKAPSEKSSDDDSGYETVGTMGKDVSLDDDSPDAQQARSQNIKSLTAQRQAALDKNDIEGAEEAGEQLSQAYSLKEVYAFTFKQSEK